MIHTKMVMQAIRAGEWFTSLDLKDAYFHVPICPEHRPFLRFAFQGQAFQFQVLPFGAASNDMWGPDRLSRGSMVTVWAWALAG